jgi:hypothetical protein
MSLRRRPALLLFLVPAGVLAALLAVGSPPEPARAAPRVKPVRSPAASTGTGTLKGRVTLKGERPDVAALDKALLAKMEANQDRKHCLEGASEEEKSQQTWRVGKDTAGRLSKGAGVANVFVWLKPPEGKYFKIDWDKKPWPKEVVIDQPHCAFVPHAAVLFPGAYEDNPDELKPSGQKFIIKNSAPMNHNVKWGGGDNPGDNKTIAAGERLNVALKPDSQPVTLRCNIHTFMNGLVRAFDHPYAAVTDKDGNYEIKDAPAGVELSVVVWHEEGGYGNKGEDGDKVTLKAGKDHIHDYTVTAVK